MKSILICFVGDLKLYNKEYENFIKVSNQFDQIIFAKITNITIIKKLNINEQNLNLKLLLFKNFEHNIEVYNEVFTTEDITKFIHYNAFHLLNKLSENNMIYVLSNSLNYCILIMKNKNDIYLLEENYKSVAKLKRNEYFFMYTIDEDSKDANIYYEFDVTDDQLPLIVVRTVSNDTNHQIKRYKLNSLVIKDKSTLLNYFNDIQKNDSLRYLKTEKIENKIKSTNLHYLTGEDFEDKIYNKRKTNSLVFFTKRNIVSCKEVSIL